MSENQHSYSTARNAIKFPFDVIHDSEGTGKATEFVFKGNNRYIRIDFGDKIGEYIYPDQFFFHLKATDSEIQKRIKDEYISSVSYDSKPSASFLHDGHLAGRKAISTCQMVTSLHDGYLTGSRAIDVYDEGCKSFGWDPSCRNKFLPMQILYARCATPEGYSVCMVTNSNLNAPFNRSKSWYNIFKGNTLKEIWFNPEDISHSQGDYSLRVSFAKNRKGIYVFKGIYKPVKIEYEEVPDGRIELVRTFERVSSTYPEKKVIEVIEVIAEDDGCKFDVTAEDDGCKIDVTVVDNRCIIDAYVFEEDKKTTIDIDTMLPFLKKHVMGKRLNETFTMLGKTYRIDKITQK